MFVRYLEGVAVADYGNRRILVTGGLGFIGIHLCKALLAHYPGASLSVVDNLSSTRTDYGSLRDRADIHVMDLRRFNAGQSKFTDIFHLASPVGSLGILERHGHIASDIIELAQVANDIAATQGARLLYLSSSEVYGRDGQHDEAAEQVVPARYGSRMEYALGKLTAEHMLMNLADISGHQLRIVRPFNVVGPWQDERLGFVVPQFFKSAFAGKPLPVHDNGLQTRSFCDVRDLVAGLIAVNESGVDRETYNVGNAGNRTSIKGLAHRVIELCASASSLQFIDPREQFGSHYLEAYNKMPVIDKVIADTGWCPRYDLDQTLTHLRDFYLHQDNYKSAKALLRDREAADCGRTPA